MSGLDEFMPKKKFQYKHRADPHIPAHDIEKCDCHRGKSNWFVSWTFQGKTFSVNQYAKETMEFWK